MASFRKEKNQNIQVFVRLRPLNNRERDIKSMGIIEVSGSKEVIVRQSPLESKLSKKFVFDRAFGPNSKQVDVYQEVVSPLIEEVLAGYNCTVFAYGQTGTGKTHTMVGESSGSADVPWQNDPMAGIIPRSLSQLFDELRITNTEYTVRVSYLELYNEELFDLLSSSEDNSKLRIYEDVTRKGANIVNGLEEVTVYNKNEVYKIMTKGQEKRRTASTLMNAQSSRSHTVFTIVVHMKENSPDGEELMKIGKLNLVDLAGSENISKAGTDNPSRKERARECVNINQSLLTLGRVITALVERHPHIPYRESKLTRLLQESLGGRTKTSIIATISPGHKDLEETLSTLEYANRAKNIQNKPEINQKITKHAVLKEYSEEIDRLKRDLLATREKNGVYLAHETYSEMTLKLEDQEKEIQDKILYIKLLKEERDRIESLFTEMSNSLQEKEKQLEKTEKHLSQTKNHLYSTKKELSETVFKVEEHEHVISKQVQTEAKLQEQAKALLDVTEATYDDLSNLHNTVDKKKALENHNLQNIVKFGDKSKSHKNEIREHLHEFTTSHMDNLQSLQNLLGSHNDIQVSNQNVSKQYIELIKNKVNEAIADLNNRKNHEKAMFETFCKERFGDLEKSSNEGCTTITEKLNQVICLVDGLNQIRQADFTNYEFLKAQIEDWNQNAMKKVTDLKNEQEEFVSEMTERYERLKDYYLLKEEKLQQQTGQVEKTRQQYQQEINDDIINLKKKFIEQIEELERKHSNHDNCIKSLEKELSETNSKRGNEVLGMINNNASELSCKGKDISNTVSFVVKNNETFYGEMKNALCQYNDNLHVKGNVFKDVKERVEDVRTASMVAWKKHSAIESAVQETIEHKQEEIADNLHTASNNILQDCGEELQKCTKNLDDTINNMNQHLNIDFDHITNLKNSIDSHKNEMEENLNFGEMLESLFLTEEYKTYSPTGKTPLRRTYEYPKDLAATSPHERIRQNFRNIRKEKSITHVIELDSTTEESPLKDEQSPIFNNNSDGSPTMIKTSTPTPVFIEPKVPPPTKISHDDKEKSRSLNDLNGDQCKENINQSYQEKKDYTSKLKQPSTLKRVLSSKN